MSEEEENQKQQDQENKQKEDHEKSLGNDDLKEQY